jgi:AAA15 family ATPase/GTPase
MLTQIHLERFKKFRDVKIQLRPFTVLMGENSSGKTTALQAINLALNLLATHSFVDTSSGKTKISPKGVGLTSFPGVNLAENRELFYGKVHRGGVTKGAPGSVLELTDDQANIYRLQITSLFGSFNVKYTSQAEELSNSPTLHTKEPLYISGFLGLRLNEERAFPRVLQDRLRSGQVSSIIRNLLLDTKKRSEGSYKKLVQRLVKDFDFYLDDDIGYDDEKDLFVRANYKDTIGDNSITLDFNSSGSGFMQILQILVPIYLYCPNYATVVLLDEPDAHLHTNLQSSLARALREIQQELGIQIIISTHSTSIIRAADPSEVVPISSLSPINEPLVSSYDVEQQITNRISTYELGKSVLSGKILFLEDTNTSVLEAFDQAAGTRCFSGANTIPVLKGKGKDDKSPFTLKEVLKEFVKSDVEIHFVRDGDGLDEKWRLELQNFAKEHNVILHHLQRHEIEN